MNENIFLDSAISNENFIIETRRRLHKYPELDFDLPITTEIICNVLDDLKIKYKKNIGKSGIVADILGKNKNITIAFRTDMDALPISEENSYDFKSQHNGKMHACGHDAHMSIILGMAKVISENIDSLPCNVRLIFQPAEETTGGAVPMINDGALENVNAIFALHVDPSISSGKISTKYGAMYASSTRLKIKIKGKSCHGAYPSAGVDAIVVAANIINSLQTIVSRNVDARESFVLSFGKIYGGESENIIAEEVTIEGIIRSTSTEIKNAMKIKIENMVKLISESMGASGEVIYTESYMALINNDNYVDIVKKSAENIIGNENVITKKVPDMIVEDFSYYLDKVPGAFFNLGVGDIKKENKPLHNNLFSIDESSLLVGLKIQLMNLLFAYETLTK